MRPKMIKLYDYYLDNGVRIIVLGDKETGGAAYAEATVIFPEEDKGTLA